MDHAEQGPQSQGDPPAALDIAGPRSEARLANRGLSRFARACFGLTLMLAPFRLRLVLISRPQPPIFHDYLDVLFFASDGLMLATLVAWLADLALHRRRVRLQPYFLTLPVFGLAVVGWISVLRSIDPLLSSYHAARLVILAVFYLYVLNEVKSIRELILPISIQVLIQAAVGAGQVLLQRDLGLQALGEYRLDPAWHGVSIVWAEGVRSLRAYGLTEHPNLLGGCLAFGLLLILAWHLAAGHRLRLLASGAFMLGCLALLLTFSRAAWLAMAAGALFMLLLLGLRREWQALGRGLGLCAGALIVCAPFLLHNLPYIGIRLNRSGALAEVPQEVQSLGARRLLTAAAGEIITASPLSGTGLGTFPLALRALRPVFPTDYQPVHVALLEATSETGVFGGLIFGTALLVPWLAMGLERRKLEFSAELLGGAGLLLAVTLVGFFDYYTWLLAPGRLWQWLAWGLWGAAYWRSRHEPAE